MEEKKRSRVRKTLKVEILSAFALLLIVGTAMSLGNSSGEGYVITVETDKYEYELGETVYISGVLTNDGLPVEGTAVGVQVDGPSGGHVFVAQVDSDVNGEYSVELGIPDEIPSGTFTEHGIYTITVAGSGTGAYASTTFLDSSPEDPKNI